MLDAVAVKVNTLRLRVTVVLEFPSPQSAIALLGLWSLASDGLRTHDLQHTPPRRSTDRTLAAPLHLCCRKLWALENRAAALLLLRPGRLRLRALRRRPVRPYACYLT